MKLLINESPLTFQPSLAKAIGLNESIVLQQVQYWLTNPKVGVEYDGHKWVHNTYEEWQTNFPFWSVEGVRKMINRLEDSGLLISAKTSKNPFDHTKSYRIDYDVVARIEADMVSKTGSDMVSEDTSIHRLPETTNNTASEEKTPSLPMDWKIATGQEITERDLAYENDKRMVDFANWLSTGIGGDYHVAYGIAYIFQKTRGIVLPQSKVKGQRKAVREMIEMGVLPNHVQEATKELMNKGMTVADLYSVAKTAISIANPPEVKYEGSLEGV